MPKVDNKTIIQSFGKQTGIRQTDLKKLIKNNSDLSGTNKDMSPRKAKRVIKDLFNEAETQGYKLKKGSSQNTRARMRGIFEYSQEQAVKTDNPEPSQDPNEKLIILQKLRQQYSPMTQGAQNKPQISAIGQNAILSGANLGNKAKTNHQKQTDDNKQENKMLPMDAKNRPNPAETQEVDLGAPAGFETVKDT
ncbi:MAG: hypothetical protein CO042_00505 [Parcubacteria group bacterium CG_4_9_14_0_2_um_filter_41_8]|nr:MAG: hypothetical protein AUJ34_02320 [Parcubacteria group bacterium CG1_02_41_12]PIP66893.1 MAG: hypothetical protein COW93_03175 [Parcubacteria group bacterium CG22_combo_CG10-13_8_21_14_all_41_9]PIQ80154.1 MAG: hypothetical protein COV79_02045 [Parcubacteria group bacterium CG11_big_fil_rev_8_21_14_0_20_41_14]PJC41048.1 MAG: hypothetical protein CO042_00505 [Parcubacteria group bacterium CG_4_9_14_0_2_um_filter_41_8]